MTLLAGLLAAFSILPYWAEADWRIDLLSHFRMQYAITGICLGIVLLLCRRFVLLTAVLLVTAYNFSLVFTAGSRPKPVLEQPAYRIMSLNTYKRNDDVASILALIERESPHIVGLLELSAHWRDSIELLEKMYPYHKSKIQRSGFGMALYSKYPISDDRFEYAGVQTLAAQVQLETGPLLVVLAHTMSPTEADHWRWRNQSLEQMAVFMGRRSGQPRILMGDLNITPWSPFFQNLLQTSGMSQPSVRILPRRTWPADNPLLWIPIDHILVSREIHSLREWTGPDVGSDHYPVFLDFQIND